MWSKIDYIHMNPVRAGIVAKIEDYIYSSANNYVNGQGIIEVELLEIPQVDVLKPNAFIKYLSPLRKAFFKIAPQMSPDFAEFFYI